MIDADDIDDENAGKSRPRLVDRVSRASTLLYTIGLSVLGVVIIVIGIVGAFHH